jgi:RNA polymerase sigma factor (sigma-70 family)
MGARGTEEIRALWTAFVNNRSEQDFYALYRQFFPYLLSIGLKISADRDLVKDVLNQQFLQLWQQRESLHNIEFPLTYVTTSFRRKLIKEGGSLSTIQELTDEHLQLFTERSPEQVNLHREEDILLQQRITNAIQRLTKRKQLLIRLKYFEGLSYAEIAAKTGLSERTIYNKMHEAIKELRRGLGKLN